MKLRPQFQLRLRDADQLTGFHVKAKRSGVSLNEWFLRRIEGTNETHAKNAEAEAGKPAPEIPEAVPKQNRRRPTGKLARSEESAQTSDAHHLVQERRNVGPLIEQAVQAKKYSHDPETCRNRFCLVCAATKEK